MRLAALFAQLVEELGARHEAVVVLEEASGQRLSTLAARFDEEAPANLVQRAGRLSAARRSGLPLQHVVGHWGFRTLDLLQDRRALVVRPETETVVGVALAELDANPAGAGRALDLGTGSGAIALALGTERAALRVIATDASTEALALAAENRARMAPAVAERVRLVAADWYAGIGGAGAFDLIVSNPPYVAEQEWADLEPVVREHDPRVALVAGASGLEGVAAVLAGAACRLVAGAPLVCEIGDGQGADVLALAEGAGATAARVERDLAGRERVLVARF
ncbi:MAG TPA: peptide chain release factor N(5)-glutamine methyltransferase [Acidimicrobiales bacterium]|nr:peptide chain release factor N(5)-glutamine methyltransferase [Acidimicrobiales bacterium]